MAKKAYIGVPFTQPKLGDLTEGTVVKINENGSPIDFYVAKHNYESGLNGEGKTLLVRKCIYGNSKAFDTTSAYSNLFADNYVDEYLNGKYKNVLDSVVQSAITNTTFYYTSKNSSSATVSTLSRGVFLLSLAEFGLTMTSTNAEGSTLPIANMLLLVTKDDGTSLGQWTRTPRLGESSGVVVVNTNGTTATVSSSNNLQAGFRPCFTLPADLGVFDGVVTGAQAETTTKSVARKIKKGYIGIENLARKIKKAYIGIGGVARPCWSGGELAYYGMITPLSTARNVGGATSNNNYAIFAGSGSYAAMVDAYNKSLVHSTPTALSENKSACGAASVGEYALFAGGATGQSTSKKVDAYNSSLTRSSTSDLVYATHTMGSANNGTYAMFGGGYSTLGVTAYNASLSKSTPANLSTGRICLAGTSCGVYVLFGGGSTKSSSGWVKTVDAYNQSLTQTVPTSLSQARSYLSATPVGNYALFAGGQTSSNGWSKTVDSYNESLTRTTVTELSIARRQMGATTIGKYAIFAAGYQSNSNYSYDTVDVYDDSLTKIAIAELQDAKAFVLATTIGEYALFAGGYRNYENVATVEAYTIA